MDRWPEFNVIVCKPQYEQVITNQRNILCGSFSVFCVHNPLGVFCFLQKGDLFKVTVVFANNEASLEEIIRNSSVIDWTKYLCLGNSQSLLLSVK